MIIKLNPDKEKVERLRKAIEDNQGFCPCMLEKTLDTYCPCKDFRDTKECHCGLYLKMEEE